MDLGINGRAALVTGASKGIGLASAMALAREGCGVHLVSSNAEAIERAKRAVEAAFPVPLRATALDLADSRSREQLLASAGPIDILVNNAGAIPGGGLDAVDEAAWRAAWELKLFGYMDFARLALPAMMARGSGVIVNVIGAAGVAPRYDYILGSTANAALVAFTQAVGAQATTRGVRMVGINPGPCATERLETLYRRRAQTAFGDASRWRELLDALPFGRPSEPEEMADLVAFLASERASYLSGVVIDADGGAKYR
ncbi:SDR family oxidoreductase [Burkholderia glumae]|uniref:SDR family oxidoreductase n=1 Tax=Burkholderia glumae TaxID=337 RepID=A0AAP9Y256_BURGL|nr:SDR family oxidoreductase [Burkholderia glumae]ACR29381.1 Short chain dehydrogenase [Burkholderia glumae BGR1]AJY67938.1 short chain dehydrogenase family protein [Burkholderia glumae LMG 2196 = ATCC 33617]KHJ63898.1 short-chain dehydrogenase [Burkholderia glumae]MCM2482888.1 SDR family oxidoreductase [Burkholderia glumae]MCM2506203.1 SDR family oxidoreductase [Burkholderia glumae]